LVSATASGKLSPPFAVDHIQAGAGVYYHPQTSEPLYTNCAFVSPGTGQFRPTPASDPHIGTAGGEVEYVDDERRVEMVCVGQECMRETVKRLREAHPYEVVALGVVKLEDV